MRNRGRVYGTWYSMAEQFEHIVVTHMLFVSKGARGVHDISIL